jgi:hypothetical protein
MLRCSIVLVGSSSTMFQTAPVTGQGIGGGGLMEFGPKFGPMFRRAAAYVDKIANGADPATLPVEEPTFFELVARFFARARFMAKDA